MKKAMTVRGVIPSDELGTTLPHEHILITLSNVSLEEPPKGYEKTLFEAPITLENLGLVCANGGCFRDNLTLDNVDDAVEELKRYKHWGGDSLVDVTPIGLGRDPGALRKISETTGVNIICGTGWYTYNSHPSEIKQNSQEELASIMVQELTEGIVSNGIRAGIIGEIGLSEPTHPNERKVLMAAIQAQKETGAPLTIHPGNVDYINKKVAKKGHEYIDLLEAEGANFERFYMSHMDGLVFDLDYQRSLLDRGVTIDYDLIGFSFLGAVPRFLRDAGVLPTTDKERIHGLKELCSQGYDKQIMLSQDICWKIRWTKYGGYGYAHILEHIVPALKVAGVSEKHINNMLIENPKRIFAYL